MGSNWTQACGIYAELWAFVRRPRWIESQRDWDGLVWRKLFLLFLLDVAVVIVSLLLIMGYEQALNLLNLPVPQTAVSEPEDAGSVALGWLLTGVLLAPLTEEVTGRGWLLGTPRALVLLVAALCLAAMGPIVVIITQGGMDAVALGAALAVLAVVGLLVLWRADGPPVPFFVRHFAWFYWFSCLWFAQIHVGNYETGSLLLIAPMLLPQFLAGVSWGFARMRFGLWASILLHAAANGILLIPFVLLGG